MEKIKTLNMGTYRATLVYYALAEQYLRANRELDVLRMAKMGELTRLEKSGLPPTLSRHTRDQLIGEIPAWVSLVNDYYDLLKQFDHPAPTDGEVDQSIKES